MKKNFIKVSAILLIASMLPLQSCIGSFGLTNRVINWNNQIGSKFVNELVFFAFWILPVYEVTSVADILVLNSIEFWSGKNPVDNQEEAYVKTVETQHGEYTIACDEKGYTIASPEGVETRLNFDDDSKTWSVISNGEAYPFMTMIDDSHVKMITPNGSFRMVELTEQGVMAYSAEVAPGIHSGSTGNGVLSMSSL